MEQLFKGLIESIIANGEKFSIGLIAGMVIVLIGVALFQAFRAILRLSADRRQGESEENSILSQTLTLYGQNVDVLRQLRETMERSNMGAEARDGRMVQALSALGDGVKAQSATGAETLAEAHEIRSLIENMPSALAAQTQTALDGATERIIAEYKPALEALVDLKGNLAGVETRVLGEIRTIVNAVERRVLDQITAYGERIEQAEQSIIRAISERVHHEKDNPGIAGVLAVAVDGGGSGGAGSASIAITQ
jgi:hypothetical protein